MINIVIVSHGDLGQALIRAAEMICGPAERVFAVSLLPGEAPEGFGDKLAEALRPIEGEETLVLVDFFGGTPYNVSAHELQRPNVECVTGANLPMLLELITARDVAPCGPEELSLSELAASIAQAGQDSIRNLGPMLRHG